MADEKLTQKTEDTAPATTDVTVTIDDTGGTPVTKKVQWANVHKALTAASTTVASVVELATAAETTTGTDATRAVTPDGLAGSDFGKRTITLQLIAYDTANTTGDGKAYAIAPNWAAGWDIVKIETRVGSTQSTSGTVDVQIARGRAATAGGAVTWSDVLSTKSTVDENEWHSKDAATASVINTSNDDLAEGDILRGDLDSIGTGSKGCFVNITIQKP